MFLIKLGLNLNIKLKTMKNYKAICENREIEEKSNMDFDLWKYSVAITSLKPKGKLVRFYIDGVEQFANDNKRNSK